MFHGKTVKDYRQYDYNSIHKKIVMIASWSLLLLLKTTFTFKIEGSPIKIKTYNLPLRNIIEDISLLIVNRGRD
jgi:hypothetical protein